MHSSYVIFQKTPMLFWQGNATFCNGLVTIRAFAPSDLNRETHEREEGWTVEDIIKQALVDEQEMTELLKDLEPFVYRAAFHLTRHQQDAEDIAQDVLYKICTKLNMFRGDSSLQTWVYSLVMNTYRDWLRKKKIRQTEELSEHTATRTFEDQADARILLEKMLADLPEIDRNILILRFQNDLSVREVAEVMNLSESNVKTKVFRLKDRLRSLFLKGGEVL